MNKPDKKIVKIPEVVSVKEFAEKADLPVTSVIAQLMRSGILATINETIDFDTALIVGDDLGLEVVKEDIEKPKEAQLPITTAERGTEPRPPVVTIMGHVDHGKTTLLDRIRSAHVVESESGGITQHISAYQVTLPETKNKELRNKTITFIDTPGHAAFSAIREHGTAITDIVVLIVAANDGVMPQTIEVIEQAKAGNVPVIVAINKIDLPDADEMRVKQQLSDHGLIPEDWGGKTIMVPISAKSGKGVDDLLEMILLQADLMELKANPDADAIGVVIESHMQKGAGPMAIVLIENGSLHQGDAISIGSSYGKARILEDFRGRAIKTALPAMPVRVAGLKSLPDFGDRLVAFSNEKEARENSSKSEQVKSKIKIATAKVLDKDSSEAEKPRLNLIIKCDVGGSLEAVKKSIEEIDSDLVELKIVSEGVGAVSESDVSLAEATSSVVYGFRVNVLGAAKKVAEKAGIKIKVFDVIYQLIDEIKKDLSVILPPEIIERELGNGKVLAIFRDDKKGFVAGGRVETGIITSGAEIKFFQNKTEKYRAKISSLRREKSEAKECEAGTECGFGLPAGANVSVGDSFIVFETIEKLREIK